MATNIEYGDVILKDVLTEGIEYHIEPDPTGVDPLYTRVTITVTSMIHTFVGATLGVAGGTQLSDSITRIIERLLVPRLRFRMLIDGMTLLDVRPGHAAPGAALNSTDVNNGPKPRVKVLNVISNTSARIEFSVELAVPNCSGKGAGYLNMRFWIADDIDDNWYTTRVYRGRLRVANKAYSPHWFRNVVMPPLFPSFRREAISFHESDNGLELDFEIRDKEVYATPPFPATKWRGHHMVVSPKVGGMIHESELRVELEGPNSVDRSALAHLASRIIDDKLHYYRKLNKAMVQLYAAFSVDLAENRVEAIARVQHFETKQSFFNTLVGDAVRDLSPNMNPPFGYRPNVAQPSVPTASLAGVFLSALDSACAPASMPKSAGSGKQADTASQTGPAISRQVGQLPPSDDQYSSQQDIAAYTWYKGRSDLHVDTGKIALPIAKTTASRPPRPGAGRSKTVSVIQLHNGFAKRLVELEAERIGEWPQLPKPIDFTDENGIEHTVLEYDFFPQMTKLAAEGLTNIFQGGIRIEYVLSRPPAVGESLPSGNLPYRTPNGGDAPSTKIPYRYFIDPKPIVIGGQ